jgi:hypothetical protein
MTRRCAGRNYLVCTGAHFVTDSAVRDSRLCRSGRRSGQAAGGSGTARHADCRYGRKSKKSSSLRASWGRGWNPRADHRNDSGKHSVHRLVSRAAPARYDQHDLAWGAAQGRVALAKSKEPGQARLGRSTLQSWDGRRSPDQPPQGDSSFNRYAPVRRQAQQQQARQ